MDHELNENTNSHKWHYTHLSLPCALRSLFTYDISFPSVHLPCITFPFRALEKILKLPFADIYIHITKKKENVYTNTYTYTFIYEHVQGIIHFFGVSSNMVVALSDCCRKKRTRIYKENLIWWQMCNGFSSLRILKLVQLFNGIHFPFHWRLWKKHLFPISFFQWEKADIPCL